MTEENGCLSCVKIPSMIINFILIIITGNIPLRSKAFKENKLVLSLAAAFSGGLFLSVGCIHLLPESNENFEDYYKEINYSGAQFPWAFLITVLSFTLILYIEKIFTNQNNVVSSDLKGNLPINCEDCNNRESLVISNNNQQLQNENEQADEVKNISNSMNKSILKLKQISQQDDQSSQKVLQDLQENIFKEQVNTVIKVVNNISFNQQLSKVNSKLGKPINKFGTNYAPYILQIAIGIHSIFEGFAIGLQTDWMQSMGISLAVICHKWAEGLTLGIAFRKAQVDLSMSTIMITIQACMSPLGIGIGWYLSNLGFLVQGIFTSISVGTFIYIATAEIIVEEFNLSRYKYLKFSFFLIAIGFICSIWFIEQITENQ